MMDKAKWKKAAAKKLSILKKYVTFKKKKERCFKSELSMR